MLFLAILIITCNSSGREPACCYLVESLGRVFNAIALAEFHVRLKIEYATIQSKRQKNTFSSHATIMGGCLCDVVFVVGGPIKI
jgi:hypothetical protein